MEKAPSSLEFSHPIKGSVTSGLEVGDAVHVKLSFNNNFNRRTLQGRNQCGFGANSWETWAVLYARVNYIRFMCLFQA